MYNTAGANHWINTSGPGKNLNLGEKQVVYFNVASPSGNEEHSAKVEQIGLDYVIITLKSTPKTVRLKDELTSYEYVTGDDKADVAITLSALPARPPT